MANQTKYQAAIADYQILSNQLLTQITTAIIDVGGTNDLLQQIVDNTAGGGSSTPDLVSVGNSGSVSADDTTPFEGTWQDTNNYTVLAFAARTVSAGANGVGFIATLQLSVDGITNDESRLIGSTDNSTAYPTSSLQARVKFSGYRYFRIVLEVNTGGGGPPGSVTVEMTSILKVHGADDDQLNIFPISTIAARDPAGPPGSPVTFSTLRKSASNDGLIVSLSGDTVDVSSSSLSQESTQLLNYSLLVSIDSATGSMSSNLATLVSNTPRSDTDNVTIISSVLPTGAATQSTLATIETETAAIQADVSNILSKVTSIDGNVVKADTDNVTIVSSSLPTGAATEATLASIDGKINETENSIDVNEAGSYANISTNTTTTVKSGAGILHSLVINTRSVAGQAVIYDNTAGSGTKIATIDTTLSTTAFLYDVKFATGLTIVTTGGGDITVSFK